MVGLISSYPIILRNLRIEDAERLHQLVGECRDSLIQNSKMQDLFFNEGYDLDANEMPRPKSFLDIPSAVIRRNITLASLSLVTRLLDTATRPQIVTVKLPAVATPRDLKRVRVVTSEGFSAEGIEEHQRLWMQEHTVRDQVRAYKEALEACFGEYNLQCVLGLMERSLRPVIPEEWTEQAQLQGRIKNAFGNLSQGRTTLFNLLDSAYYDAGSHLFHQLGPHYEGLNKKAYGQRFTLTPEEMSRAAVMHRVKV